MRVREDNSEFSVRPILEGFLSSYDLGDPELNQAFKATAEQVMPDVLIPLYFASHLECGDQSVQDATIDKQLTRFLHGLLFAVFGLHSLETLIDFDKHVLNPTGLHRSLAFCTGGLCLANASLILRNEDESVLNEIYGLISAAAHVELKRRRSIGRFDFTREDYITLCKELSTPTKLFVVGPITRNGGDKLDLEKFVKFVEYLDISNRLVKELNICFNIQGNLAAELRTEQPPLLLQLAARHGAIGNKVTLLLEERLGETAISEIRATLLKTGLVDEVRAVIEDCIMKAKEILPTIRNHHSRMMLQLLLNRLSDTYEYCGGLYKNSKSTQKNRSSVIESVERFLVKTFKNSQAQDEGIET